MKKKVLVCDDDGDIREITSLILRKGGYDVKVIETGKKIMEEIAEYQPDILLLDVMIPDEDGKEITRRLKANETTRDVPVLLFTAVNNPDSITLESGADGYISKPFEMNELLRKVEGYIRPRASAA